MSWPTWLLFSCVFLFFLFSLIFRKSPIKHVILSVLSMTLFVAFLSKVMLDSKLVLDYAFFLMGAIGSFAMSVDHYLRYKEIIKKN